MPPRPPLCPLLSCPLLSCPLARVSGEQHSQLACICQIFLPWTPRSAVCVFWSRTVRSLASHMPFQRGRDKICCRLRVSSKATGAFGSNLSVSKAVSKAGDSAEQAWIASGHWFICFYEVLVHVAVMAVISQACWLSQGECRQQAF